MIKKIALICLCSSLQGYVSGQPSPAPHFEPEYSIDAAADTLRWNRLSPGLHVSFGTTDTLYMRKEAPRLAQETAVWEATGWKGERLNTVLLVWSADSLDQLRVTAQGLSGPEGHTIAPRNMQLNLVRYVVSNFPYGATNVTCGSVPDKPAWLMPDRLESFDRFELPGRTTRPVWLSVDIPADAAPGIYQGTIAVQSERSSTTLQVRIKVQDQQLPPPQAWQYRLDLWQNPWVIAWYYHLKPWSEEHKALLKKHLQLYADAGGKYITTYAVHSPWQDNSYMIEGGMIEWIRQQNGAWKFDYNIFDQYVTLAMEAGVDKAITIYTPVPWGHRFRYLDEASGNYQYATWPPDSKIFREQWRVFLSDLKAHLQQKGWLNKTYLGINENPLEHTLAAIRVIKEHSPEWKITYAGNWHPELDSLLDDYCYLYGQEPPQDAILKRRAKGFTTTYYVCCNPAKPNNFLFSPPAEGRWISWYSAARGYDGFLRWAYDAWPADPVRDARHVLWPAGDCFLVYPGANSSIRFEKLREGIADYEKIRILREKAAQSKDRNVKQLMNAFEQHLQTFARERKFDEMQIRKALDKGKEMINELSAQLPH